MRCTGVRRLFPCPLTFLSPASPYSLFFYTRWSQVVVTEGGLLDSHFERLFVALRLCSTVESVRRIPHRPLLLPHSSVAVLSGRDSIPVRFKGVLRIMPAG